MLILHIKPFEGNPLHAVSKSSVRGDRIGVLVEVSGNPTHTYVGTTVFNNFVKKYPYQWNLGVEVRRIVERSVNEAGFTVVDLRQAGFDYQKVAGLIQTNGDKWQGAAGRKKLCANFENLTESEFQLVREGILSFTQEASNAVLKALNVK